MKFHEYGFDFVTFVYMLDSNSILIFMEGDKIEGWLYVLEVTYEKANKFCFVYLLID